MPETKKPTHWLDIIPAGLPLERLLPVINLTTGRQAPPWRRGKDWRIDLNEPAGFGFALRLLAQHPEPASWSGAHGWVWRHLRGNTTDADRVAVAKALAEVMS